MFKLVTVLCILSALCILRSYATISIIDGKHDEHPGHCFYEEESTELKAGEKKSFAGQECCMVECNDDFNIVKTCCGLDSFENLPPFCKVIQDEKKPHPGCCGKVQCEQIEVPAELKP